MAYDTYKLLEMHGLVLSPMATDALGLQHQGISSHTAD